MTARGSWVDANQAFLGRELSRLRARLSRQVDAPRPDAASSWNEAAPPTLEQACTIFRLSSFERDLLLLCAAVELDASFAALCAEAQGDTRRPYPTFSLALASLEGAHWSALSPDRPLRAWHLLDVGQGETVTSAPLRIDERVLHYLAGVPAADERLRGLVSHATPPGMLPPTYQDAAHLLSTVIGRTGPAEGRDPIQLCGDDPAGTAAVAAAAAGDAGLCLLVLDATALPNSAFERDTLVRLCEREAALTGAALLVDHDEVDQPEQLRALAGFVERVRCPLVIAGREPLALRRRAALRVDVPQPPMEDRLALWKTALGPHAALLNGQVEELATQFNLRPVQLEAVRSQALAQVETTASRQELSAALWQACRTGARTRMDQLAQRIEPSAGWDNLVLPDLQRQVLRDIGVHMRQRFTVYQSWGFASRGHRGLGITALFAGASGTGKTMAAEVLAGELDLDLYRIDLSAIVNKYIGETEKNLRRVFDAAEEGGAILLFDEADALFGKRSEVRDSHDRYANIEVSYLLQRMESYNGLAVLTTNMKDALDTAFMRRIRFVVQFPFPDPGLRAEIWRRIFPPSTPLEGIDASRLARLNIAGGNIRNIALNAAFFAADEGGPVRMRHLARAARAEYAKLERPLSEAEMGDWS